MNIMRFSKSSILLFALFCCGLVISCGDQQKDNDDQENTAQTVSFEPVHSYARPQEAVVKHLDLDITVNFDEHKIAGQARYKIDNKQGVDTIVFDARQLTIEKVTLNKENEKTTDYLLGPSKPHMGRPLKVVISPETDWVNINYKTSPQAGALQWLKPQQTADENAPYLFTQSQPILARTWIPCQDAPGIRYTYEARVEVPEGMMAVMSAANPIKKNEEGVYHFKMKQPIPSYLMALAVGNIEYKKLSKRTGVYSEPSVVEDAAYELAKMEDMMKAAEELYGPYRWEQYDVIILPPSFPFGGMENPRLSFATPTILAGDRSLTNLIAHELAHSWSGNLVTNATWNSLWLNEGFTVYIERRLMEALYGKDYANMLRVLGFRHLKNRMKKMMKNNPDDTRLKMNLKGRDPDEGLSVIPYEKGALFLKTIEQYVGRERFDQFLKKYFNTYAFQSMTSDHFVEYLNKHLVGQDSTLQQQLKVKEWIYKPGIPDNYPSLHSKRFDSVRLIAQRWKNGVGPEELPMEDWTTHEWIYFLDRLPDTLSTDRMTALDQAYHFTDSANAEILADWLEIAINSQYEPAYDRLEKFLIRVGRRKFLRPLYTALAKTKKGKKWAREIYRKARPNYHSISRHTIDKILDWNK